MRQGDHRAPSARSQPPPCLQVLKIRSWLNEFDHRSLECRHCPPDGRWPHDTKQRARKDVLVALSHSAADVIAQNSHGQLLIRYPLADVRMSDVMALPCCFFRPRPGPAGGGSFAKGRMDDGNHALVVNGATQTVLPVVRSSPPAQGRGGGSLVV